MPGSNRAVWTFHQMIKRSSGRSLTIVTDDDVVIADWRLWMGAKGLSQRTIRDRTQVVGRLLRDTNTTAGTVGARDIQVFLARDVSATTKATYHAHVRAFTAWMQRTGVRDDNPADRTPRPRRPKSTPRPVTPAQVQSMLAHANRRRTYAYIMLAAYAGLRVHEIAKLRGEDIADGLLTVTGKGGKTATIPVHNNLAPLVDRAPKIGYWFPSPQMGGDHIHGTAVSAAIHDCMRRSGVSGTPHALRHFYGTELVKAGVNLRVVQVLMRHESPATTAIYTLVDQGQMRDGIDRMVA